MTKPRLDAAVEDQPPDNEHVTEYDRLHFITYARLLDAQQDPTATWEEVARLVLKLDPEGDPIRARCVYDAHLARAQWMTQAGYRDLIPGGRSGRA